MHSTSNMQPIEDSSNEAPDLLNILPHEVWILVLRNVTDVEDLENIWNASIFFRLLLNSKRVVFLFPKIWSLVEPTYNSLYFKSLGIVKENNSEIAKLRLVCRTWCNTIDEISQSSQYYYKLQDDPTKDNNVIGRYWAGNCFQSSTRKAKRCLQHFLSTHTGNGNVRCPFIGRSLLMYHYFNINFAEETENNCLQILKLYGHHIWYFEVYMYESLLRLNPCYTKLRQFLLLMPNLKYLHVRFHSLLKLHVSPTPTELSELQSSPMPNLDQLQYLRLRKLPFQVFAALINTFSHVNMLEVDQIDEYWAKHLFTKPMSNLVQLSMKFHSIKTFVDFKHAKVSLPLTTIRMVFDQTLETIKWSSVFKSIEIKFGNTVNNAVIHLTDWKKLRKITKDTVKRYNKLEVNLPKLKGLNLKLSNLSTIDFLLPMRNSLEVLVVGIKFDYKQVHQYQKLVSLKGGQIVEFIGYTNKMLESNIWSIFTKLNIIVVHEDEFVDEHNLSQIRGHRIKTFYYSRKDVKF